MAMKRDASGTPTDLTVLKRRSGGSWVDMLASTHAFRRLTSAWVDLLPGGGGGGGLSATVSNNNISQTYFCNDPEDPFPPICAVLQVVTTNPVTVTAVGGSGAGPTYSWARISGYAGMTISDATSNVVQFSCTLTQDSLQSAVWRCTVTRGLETATVDVTATCWYDWSKDGYIEP